MKRSINSLLHFSEKSEEIFKIYGFDDPEEIFLLSGRHYSDGRVKLEVRHKPPN